MTALFSKFPSIRLGATRALLAFALVAGFAVRAQAQEQQNYLSEKVSEELKKLDEFQKNKDWDNGIKLINGLLKDAKPESYDQAMLLQFLGKVYYMKNDYNSAIDPLEKCLRLGIAKNYFKPDNLQEFRLFIMQAYFTNAMAKGASIQEQKKNYLAAEKYMDEWNKNSTKTSPEVTQMNAYIYFGLAQTNLETPNKIDINYVKKAQAVIERALTETARPKDNLYTLLIGCLQQQEDWVRVAETYELLCKKQPTNKQNWGQLFAAYYTLSQDQNPEKAFDYSIRALVTLDRAQALGIMNTPKDNFNRVAIYFNIQQHDAATEVLYNGLMNGTIEDTPKNWEILIYSYQQVMKDEKAVMAAKEALKRYPERGGFYMLMAGSYYNLDKMKESYEAGLNAIKVGHLDRPHQAYAHVATIAFHLRLFDEGLVYVKKALEFPESKKDAQLPQLKKAIEESLKERELNKRAIEQQHQNL